MSQIGHWPQDEKEILMGRKKIAVEYMRTHGYTITDTLHTEFLKAINGKAASLIIRKLIIAYLANQEIIAGIE